MDRLKEGGEQISYISAAFLDGRDKHKDISHLSDKIGCIHICISIVYIDTYAIRLLMLLLLGVWVCIHLKIKTKSKAVRGEHVW